MFDRDKTNKLLIEYDLRVKDMEEFRSQLEKEIHEMKWEDCERNEDILNLFNNLDKKLEFGRFE